MKKIIIAGIAGIIIGGLISFGGIYALADTGIAKVTNAGSDITAPTSGTISLVDAQSIALNKVPGSVITSFEFDNGTTPIYEATLVSGYTEYELDINAKTGVITKFETENKDYKNSVINSNLEIIKTNNFISVEKAKEIALAKAPSSKIIGFSLDYENITPQYDVELISSTDKYEIDVNAKTGTIISTTKEILPATASTSTTATTK